MMSNKPSIHLSGEKVENDEHGVLYNKVPSDFDIFDEEDSQSESDNGSDQAKK